METKTESKEYWELNPEERVEDPEHPGYRKKTMLYGNCRIEVYRPILDEKERKKREAHVKTWRRAVERSLGWIE
mgnify:CR=1 FL=1